MKKTIPLIVIILILIVGYYLVSPLWNVKEADEPSPLDVPISEDAPVVKDAMLTMTPEEKKEFEEAVESVKDMVINMSEKMPKEASTKVIAQGAFKESAHGVTGEALLIQSEGKKILRFENFETINGPNLHIYLSSDLGDEDYIDLGAIRATKGNVNYEIPEGVDTNKYKNVLVWCVPFRVLFSYAQLQ